MKAAPPIDPAALARWWMEKYKGERTSYGRESDEGRFASWLDALAYVRLNHWSGLDD